MRLLTAGLVVVILAGCSSDVSPETTSPVTTSVSSTSVAVSPTAAEVTQQVSTTAATTTTVPDTTEPAPSTTTVVDQLLEAVDRAQTAMRNCMKSLAEPCDQTELENALVGVQLEGWQEISGSGNTVEGEDELVWTVIDGPKLKGDELAVATVCAFDPVVVTTADGQVDDDAVYYLQEWQLLSVGGTWKLSEIINQAEAPTEAEACGA